MVHSQIITLGLVYLSIAFACGSVALAQSATAVTPAQEAAIEAGIKDGAWQCVSGHASVIPTKP
jgi:hypothetical protein